MKELGFSYESLLRQAGRLSSRSHGLAMDAEDLAQETVAQSLLSGAASVDAEKGTAAMWAAGVVWNLWCGEIRRCVRARSSRPTRGLS